MNEVRSQSYSEKAGCVGYKHHGRINHMGKWATAQGHQDSRGTKQPMYFLLKKKYMFHSDPTLAQFDVPNTMHKPSERGTNRTIKMKRQQFSGNAERQLKKDKECRNAATLKKKMRLQRFEQCKSVFFRRQWCGCACVCVCACRLCMLAFACV